MSVDTKSPHLRVYMSVEVKKKLVELAKYYEQSASAYICMSIEDQHNIMKDRKKEKREADKRKAKMRKVVKGNKTRGKK